MRAAKIDENQPEIVEALRKAGISVFSAASLGMGFPDLVCAKGDKVWLIEVKGPKGKPTPEQLKFMATWRGAVYIARTPEDALQIVGAI